MRFSIKNLEVRNIAQLGEFSVEFEANEYIQASKISADLLRDLPSIVKSVQEVFSKQAAEDFERSTERSKRERETLLEDREYYKGKTVIEK